MGKQLGTAFLAVLVGLAGLSLPRSARAESPLTLLSFQVGGLAVFPAGGVSGNDSYTFQAAWTPLITAGPLGLRGEVGVAPLKTATGVSYLQINFEGFFQFSLFPLIGLELGGGYQTLTKSLGSAGVLSANLTVSLLGPIDRVYAGYSRFLLGNDANQFKLGIGLVF